MDLLKLSALKTLNYVYDFVIFVLSIDQRMLLSHSLLNVNRAESRTNISSTAYYVTLIELLGLRIKTENWSLYRGWKQLRVASSITGQR